MIKNSTFSAEDKEELDQVEEVEAATVEAAKEKAAKEKAAKVVHLDQEAHGEVAKTMIPMTITVEEPANLSPKIKIARPGVLIVIMDFAAVDFKITNMQRKAKAAEVVKVAEVAEVVEAAEEEMTIKVERLENRIKEEVDQEDQEMVKL